MRVYDQRGITKVQGVVILALVFVCGVLAVLVGRYTALKNQDTAILSDIARIQSGLDVVYGVNARYPLREEGVYLHNQQAKTEKLCSRDFADAVTSCETKVLDPLPGAGRSHLGYRYWSLNQGAEYRIEFNLNTNHTEAGLLKGVQCAFVGGVQSIPCFNE